MRTEKNSALLRSFDNGSYTGSINVWSLRDSKTVAPSTHNYPTKCLRSSCAC